MDLSIVVPYLNEVDNVQKLKEDLLPVVADISRTYSVEMVFVDDGSTDGTTQALKSAVEAIETPEITYKFVAHEGNWGLGKALQTGFSASRGDIVITTDCDGTYQFSTIPELLAHLQDGVDVVTASPYHPKGKVLNVPGYRIFLSKGASFIYRLLVNWNIHTYTCLFRAYRRQVVEEIHIASYGFMSVAELLIKSKLRGYQVVEFPAVLYTREYGVSKANLARTILAHLRFQSSILLHNLHLTTLVERENEKRWGGWVHTKYSVMGENLK